MEMANENLHIVMFPYMAQGHIIPFLALALHIDQKHQNYNITFVNTPLNIQNIKTSLPQNSSIKLHQLPFNSSNHGLPPLSENTDGLPHRHLLGLLQASKSLMPSFKTLISNLKNKHKNSHVKLCIVSDIFLGWTAEVAKEFGVFHAIFTSGGFGLACYHAVWSTLPYKKLDFWDDFSLPDFPEAGVLHVTQLSADMVIADGEDPYTVFLNTNFGQWLMTDAMMFNTVEELDQTGLDYFRRKIAKPVWAIGPIVLAVDNKARTGKETGISTNLCKEWLNTKPINSVLYVSFGSQNTISASQMNQLAIALESSGQNFIWVIKPPLNFDMNSEFEPEEWVPEGFLQRIEDNKTGLVVKNWGPQELILSHESVSAFLSHCGWNSALEALRHGVTLIGWPMGAEQFFNVKFMEEKIGVCAEVARGTGFEVRHEDIMKKIDLVMGENEKGIEMRRKACEIKDVIMDAVKDDDVSKGSSVIAMDEFLNAVLLFGKKTEC